VSWPPRVLLLPGGVGTDYACAVVFTSCDALPQTRFVALRAQSARV